MWFQTPLTDILWYYFISMKNFTSLAYYLFGERANIVTGKMSCPHWNPLCREHSQEGGRTEECTAKELHWASLASAFEVLCSGVLVVLERCTAPQWQIHWLQNELPDTQMYRVVRVKVNPSSSLWNFVFLTFHIWSFGFLDISWIASTVT